MLRGYYPGTPQVININQAGNSECSDQPCRGVLAMLTA